MKDWFAILVLEGLPLVSSLARLALAWAELREWNKPSKKRPLRSLAWLGCSIAYFVLLYALADAARQTGDFPCRMTYEVADGSLCNLN